MKKSLKEYADVLEKKGLLISRNFSGSEEQIVESITYDSKKAGNGCLFICKGAAFKREYLVNAVQAGCIGYISETDHNIPGVPYCIVKDIRDAMPPIASMFYDIPEDLKVTGLTGTKGKTTTAYFIKSIFDEAMHSAGKPEIAFLSTIETYDGKERISSGITTPESFEIYRHFRNAYDSGIRNVVMEVSSQALKYKRTDGIEFDTAVFLNISEDHISPVEHPDFEDYFESKLKLFKQCRTAIICTETDHFDRVKNAAADAEELITFGFKEDADIYGFDIKSVGDQTAFSVKYKDRTYDFVLNMRGSFNVENALAAIALAFKYGISYEHIDTALKKVSVPGRWEEYSSDDGKIRVIVDYAHNGFSLSNIVKAAKEFWKERRIVTVFGCTGDKAVNRRKDMGLAAGELCDRIYLTADDPAGERVEDICAQIGVYIKEKNSDYEVIPDRKEAIKKAINDCDEASVVLILGKGSERTQKTAKGNESYESDAVIAVSAIEIYNKNMMKKKERVL